MIKLKTPEDIERLAEGGAILAEVLDVLEKEAVVGALPIDLDARARELLAERDCIPSFLGHGPPRHEPFTAALCVSANNAVVHGVPTNVPFASGDLVSLDLGLIYQERYYLDSARTVSVGEVATEAQRLADVTREALAAGINAALPGNRIGDIGAAIQVFAEDNGYGNIRQLIGHGVGFEVWEDPQVPNYGKPGEGVQIEEGLVIAIEPMFTMGSSDVSTAEDGWTIITADGSISAHAEHSVAITESGPKILT